LICGKVFVFPNPINPEFEVFLHLVVNRTMSHEDGFVAAAAQMTCS
jgi:hypothetical protein